ncbi:MAG TPA: SDR family oxidoreductase [Tepidiformaceae bacterium]|nr:SDR family oxidoreductase [Tepidiformaceae bacterium]
MDQARRKVALVTGASRGVGARVAELLGAAGCVVVVNYRSKQRRAEEVAAEVEKLGGQALCARADLTDRDAVGTMLRQVSDAYGRLDLLILNASGGLERAMPADYAMALNRDAQVGMLEAALPLMSSGGQVVFVTSHMAHFHGRQPVLPVYEPVAVSKRAGEDALRSRIPQLTKAGVRLVVVSGDLIDGTTTPRLMQRKVPGIIGARREMAGWLPTIDDFARAIVAAADDQALASGDTVYVGSTA